MDLGFRVRTDMALGVAFGNLIEGLDGILGAVWYNYNSHNKRIEQIVTHTCDRVVVGSNALAGLAERVISGFKVLRVVEQWGLKGYWVEKLPAGFSHTYSLTV